MARKKSPHSNIAVCYARYSSHNQKDASIEQQVEACCKYAQGINLHISESYEDRAISGKSDARPAFQRMMKDAENGKFGYLISWKSNRIGRNMLEAMLNEERLRAAGVKVLYVEEDFDDSAAGRFALRSMMNVNQFYSENMAEDIKRGLYDNAKQCKVANGRLPYGYKADENLNWVIDEPKAAIVREIFTRVSEGEPFISIVNDFNRRGYKTSNNRDWNRSSFQRIIVNERYRGVYMYGDIRIEDGVPRIVDDALFFKTQEVLKTKSHARGSHRANSDYLLTGKLFCGKCGALMTGLTGTGRHGGMFYYYGCSRKKQHACDKKNVRRDDIELTVATAVREMVMKDDVVEWIADKTMECYQKLVSESPVSVLKDRLKEVQHSIDNLLKVMEKGASSDSIIERLNDLESEKKDLNAKIALETNLNQKVSREDVIAALRLYRNGDVNDKKYQANLFDTFVKAVYVFDDKIKIAFDFSNDDKEITLPLLQDTDTADNDKFECSSLYPSPPPIKYLKSTSVCLNRGAFFGFMLIVIKAGGKLEIKANLVLQFDKRCVIIKMSDFPIRQDYRKH